MGRLRRVDDSKMSSGIFPPDVGEFSRRFEGTVAFIVKGGRLQKVGTIHPHRLPVIK